MNAHIQPSSINYLNLRINYSHALHHFLQIYVTGGHYKAFKPNQLQPVTGASQGFFLNLVQILDPARVVEGQGRNPGSEGEAGHHKNQEGQGSGKNQRI